MSTNQSSEVQTATTTTSPATDAAAFEAWLQQTPELDGPQTIMLPISLNVIDWLHVAQIARRQSKPLGLVLSENIDLDAVLAEAQLRNDPDQGSAEAQQGDDSAQ
jgi:hypothetical protein